MKTFFPKHKTKFLKTFIAVISFLFFQLNIFGQTQVTELRQKFITYSLGFVGMPYVYGGTNPEEDGGFDCSGYVKYVIENSLNMKSERTAQSMYDTCEIIPENQREPGDLVFFKNNMKSTRITHVGIYLGEYNHGKQENLMGKKVFVSAVSDGPQRGIIISAMDENFWSKHYYATGRILPPTNTYE